MVESPLIDKLKIKTLSVDVHTLFKNHYWENPVIFIKMFFGVRV